MSSIVTNDLDLPVDITLWCCRHHKMIESKWSFDDAVAEVW